MRSVTVVGASLAGLSTARALRDSGFDGRIALVGAERHAPYDRPPLSKEFLAGTATRRDIDLTDPEDDDLDLQWRLGTNAVRLDRAATAVHLDTGERIASDAVVVATGARARRLPGALSLRTVEDAVALRERLVPGARLVVVGAGFIGAEIASTAVGLGAEVTVVEALPVPLAAQLGPQLGAVCAGWHTEHGVRLITGRGVRAVGEHAVQLDDGTTLGADVVLAGIGAAPRVEWLAGSGLDAEGGVPTDSRCATALPGVYAVGDCARSPRPPHGRAQRVEHWSNAVTQGRIAAAGLLGHADPVPARDEVPSFWSDQYGCRVQLAGQPVDGDEVAVDGDIAARSFVARYRRDGALTAVLAVNQPRQFGRLRRELANSLYAPA